MPSEARVQVRLWLRLWRLRWLRLTLLVLASTVAIFLAAGLWITRHAEPLIRSSILAALQEHFQSRVEIDAIHFKLHHPSLFGGTVVAEMDGLRIWLPEPEEQQKASHRKAESTQPWPSQSWFKQPWITVQHLRFTASVSFLRRRPLRLSNVQVEGVRLLIPPRGYRPRLDAAHLSGQSSLVRVSSVEVDQINCSNVFLEMERMPATGTASAFAQEASGEATAGLVRKSPAKPSAAHPLLPGIISPGVASQRRLSSGTPAEERAVVGLGRSQQAPLSQPVQSSEPTQSAREPLQFQIASLVLNPGVSDAPIRFYLQMTNPRPVGQIVANGELGPWTVSGSQFDPGALPIRGSYSFEQADLATFRGIAGTLSSTGSFRGILRQARINGETSTPDFRLTRHGAIPPASVGLPLWTRFSATVDGTNGNTVLDQVEATLGKTRIRASGRILRVEYRRADVQGAQPYFAIGHDLLLHVRVDQGRIADLLQVVTANSSPLVTGNVALTNTLHLPPGTDAFRERLALDGQFDATEVHFTSDSIERNLTQLSLRGQGDPEALHNAQVAPVSSTMSGHISLVDGVLALPDLIYQVPGAQIHLHGTYTLEGGALDFNGDARMPASLSKMVGGWKGLLLSPINRIFARNGAGTDIPIRLSGTRAEPHISIDFSRLGKSNPAYTNQPHARH